MISRGAVGLARAMLLGVATVNWWLEFGEVWDGSFREPEVEMFPGRNGDGSHSHTERQLQCLLPTLYSQRTGKRTTSGHEYTYVLLQFPIWAGGTRL
jgi:hypothetical protein